jgi:phage baseplate assembly protein gpV
VPAVADAPTELAETLQVEAAGAEGATIAGGAATITILEPHAPADFDGNGRSDVTIYRQGAWLFFDRATGAYTHGVFTGQPGNCIPAPADYDGDGHADLVQFCADRFHFYDLAGDLTKTIVTGGDGTDLPVPADYDGDGRADLTVFRHGAWLSFDTASGAFVHGVWTGEPVPFVGPRSVPVAADFDGDGRADFSVYAGGAWHFYNPDGSYRRGIWTGAVAGDLAVPGDHDGDGIADVVVWRAGAWIWFDRDTGLYDAARSVWTGAPPNFVPGTPLPAPLDVDGDGRLDLAVYSGGPWHFFQRDGAYAGGVWCGAISGDRPISARQLP